MSTIHKHVPVLDSYWLNPTTSRQCRTSWWHYWYFITWLGYFILLWIQDNHSFLASCWRIRIHVAVPSKYSPTSASDLPNFLVQYYKNPSPFSSNFVQLKKVCAISPTEMTHAGEFGEFSCLNLNKFSGHTT